MKLRKTMAWLLILAGAFWVEAGLGSPAAEATRILIDVDTEEGTAKPKQKAAPETFPVTLVNKTREKLFVALLYYDGNAKNWRCRGWWGVEPQKKRAFKLSHVPDKHIYYYVQRSNGRRFTRTGTPNGVNWNVSKQPFSYLHGGKNKLDKPYKVHFVRTCPVDDGWWQLTLNP